MGIFPAWQKALLLSSIMAVLAYLFFFWSIDWQFTLYRIEKHGFWDTELLVAGVLPIFISSYLAYYFSFSKTCGLTQRILLISITLSSLLAIYSESPLGVLAGIIGFIFLYPAIHKLYVIRRYLRLHQQDQSKLLHFFNLSPLIREAFFGSLAVAALFLILVATMAGLNFLGVDVRNHDSIIYGILMGSVSALSS
jgi:hypothetical protein